MHLLIASHKHCWTDPNAGSGFATDGGFSAQVEAIATMFDRTTLCVPCSSGASPAGLTPITGTIDVHPLPATTGPLWRRRQASLGWLPRLVAEVRSADAVHAPLPGDVGTMAALVALAARKPLFVRHCGNWRAPVTRTDRWLKWLLERTAGERVVVMATGADPSPPSPAWPWVTWIYSSSISDADLPNDAASRQPPPPGRARLITGGRLIAEKGTDTVMLAFAKLHAVGLAAHLDVVGDGPARPMLETLACELGVADLVTFHGRLTRSAVLDALDRADLFVYPTRSSEGFPKLVLEAASRGLPVVATAVSAIPPIIEGAGSVVDGDAGSVSAAVGSIVANPDRYRAYRDRAMENASRYTLERWIASLESSLVPAWGPLREPREVEALT